MVTMSKIRLIFSADGAGLGERMAEALAQAGYALSFGLHDQGDLDPQPIAATLIIWTPGVLRAPALCDEAEREMEAGRLVPVSIGTVDIPGRFRSLEPANLAGWIGHTGDPRWLFVLDEIDIAVKRSSARARELEEAKAPASADVDPRGEPIGGPDGESEGGPPDGERGDTVQAGSPVAVRTPPLAKPAARRGKRKNAARAGSRGGSGSRPTSRPISRPASRGTPSGNPRGNQGSENPGKTRRPAKAATQRGAPDKTATRRKPSGAAIVGAIFGLGLISLSAAGVIIGVMGDGERGRPLSSTPDDQRRVGTDPVNDRGPDTNNADGRSDAETAPRLASIRQAPVASSGGGETGGGEAALRGPAADDPIGRAISEATQQSGDQRLIDGAAGGVPALRSPDDATAARYAPTGVQGEAVNGGEDGLDPGLPSTPSPGGSAFSEQDAAIVVALNENAAPRLKPATGGNDAVPTGLSGGESGGSVAEGATAGQSDDDDDDPIAQLAWSSTRQPADSPVPSGADDLLGNYFKECVDCPDMAVVPAGVFTIGSPSTEAAREAHEGPQRAIALERDFALSVYEVTFQEWEACVAEGGCRGYRPPDPGWGRGRRPVVNVSFEDAQRYVQWLSQKTGARYRLPSEAEWEYAARASHAGPFGFDGPLTPSKANYHGDFPYNGPAGLYRRKTLTVGSFDANFFGLHDMHGNVWEWVADCWQPSHAARPPDGAAYTESGCSSRVVRGGAWSTGGWRLRAAHRQPTDGNERAFDIGFRVARDMR